MNPYEPPTIQPNHASDKFICEKCKQEAERPGILGTTIGWIMIVVFVFLATHGLMTILKQRGIVVNTIYGAEFWFENDVRKVIWRQ